ncbi:MAG: hypothetical protein HFI34_01450 [Lachnospiraceae bacterium]|nr:hypothetical protein [Lachnospiraceae bacterium]
MFGKVKLHNLSPDEQLKVAKALKEKAPLKTDGDVDINIRVKNGYDISNINGVPKDMTMKCVGILQHLMHLLAHHPIGELIEKSRVFRWKRSYYGCKVTRISSYKRGIDMAHNGKPYYVSRKEWEDAGKAYKNGTATQEQLDLLKFGHYI